MITTLKIFWFVQYTRRIIEITFVIIGHNGLIVSFLHLVTPEASNVTGQAIIIDGGLSLNI